MTVYWKICAIVIVGCFASAAHAEGCWVTVREQLEAPTGMSTVDTGKLNSEARNCLSSLLSDPVTLNRALHLLTSTNSGGAFLRDIHFVFKTFQAPDLTGSTGAHLGVSYAYDKSFVTAPLGQECGDACVTALDLKLSSQGNIAFESDINPRDFLETHVTAIWFRSSGGAQRLSPDARDQYNDLALKMAMVPAGQEAELQQYYRQLSRLIANNLTNQWYFAFGADVAFESDQAFRQKHWVYAAHAALDFRGWMGMDAVTWQDASMAAKLNIFDYPFALIRRLSGYSDCYSRTPALGSCITPLGTSWPSVSLALGRVQPLSNDTRAQLIGYRDEYTRVTTEISFKTPLARWEQQPIYLTANYRIFDELSAPDSVKSADLAHFRYLAIIVGPQRGFFASYSTGRLPFDRRNDQVYELGFRTFLQ